MYGVDNLHTGFNKTKTELNKLLLNVIDLYYCFSIVSLSNLIFYSILLLEI